MYVYVNWVTIGSDHGLLPVRHQATIWTNDGLLLIEPLGTNFSEYLNKITKIIIQENTFENVIYKITAMLSQPQCVKNVIKIKNAPCHTTEAGDHIHSGGHFSPLNFSGGHL